VFSIRIPSLQLLRVGDSTLSTKLLRSWLRQLVFLIALIASILIASIDAVIGSRGRKIAIHRRYLSSELTFLPLSEETVVRFPGKRTVAFDSSRFATSRIA
jgi:hypothetical protein